MKLIKKTVNNYETELLVSNATDDDITCLNEIGFHLKSSENGLDVLVKENVLRLPLSEDTCLIAEIGADPDYKEIFIGIEKNSNDNNIYWQDLAIVNQHYHYDNGNIITDNGQYRVCVFADKNKEDYTDHFIIEEYNTEREN